MNLRKSARWWLCRPKDLIHFWQIHNFCERLSCDWSFFSICKWNMVYSAGENSELPLLHKTQTHTYCRRCLILWTVWVQATHMVKILGNKARKLPWGQTTVVRMLEQMKKSLTKTIDGHGTEGKHHMHRGLQASMFNTDRRETTFCVLIQHSTVGWHTVPWLHIALIFCGTELRPHRYCSHPYKTMVEGKAVPVYSMKTMGKHGYNCTDL